MENEEFSEWKTLTAVKLLEIKKKYSSNEKIVRDVDILLTKLEYLRASDLAIWLVMLHHASTDCPEFLEVLPSIDELKEWFKEEMR
jgi:hypothetical protein